MNNICTKFEVSIYIRDEEIKGGARCKMGWFVVVMGHSRSSAMSPFDRAHDSTVIETMHLSCIVFNCIWRPRMEWHWSNFPEVFGNRKLDSLVRRCLRDPICSAFLVEHRTCDGQTERHASGQTQGHGIYRASIHTYIHILFQQPTAHT